ncbi:Signal peptide peptidase SppA [Candidatus Nitromaritima sp. SCGC AAA799-A02]|nr:Signal peptide peptidase SppA [Candidatus Nitromaritima sp. SCGC AAA799-C22]KMP11636.1 Signal peptide peptidase SppA [Candidatus Nitromaritima sp. SCGC AAA799-A02]
MGCVLFSACAVFQLGPRIQPLEEKVIEEGDGPGKILLVDIDGPISNRPKRMLTGFQVETGMIDRIREVLKKAGEDEKIQAILLRINSPGGTVTSSDILYHEFKTFKEKQKVPIYVSVVDIAASGGYYIAMAGDKIVAHPTSLTGSIGVLALKVNLEGLMGKVGVGWEVVKSGDKKDFMSPFRPLTDEERKLFQETIDRYYERFVMIVEKNRPRLDRAAVKTLADGRIYEARQALSSHLVDAIGYLDDTVEMIRTELKEPGLQVVAYHRPGDYKSNIYSSSTGPSGFNLIHLDLGLDLNKFAPQFMYLWGY